ncbi:GNAT family N-acetyltransferase [Chitinophaga agrisoli]|uniref:GNAT family N-acetyltransferase n=1 Tax=Chitinophaga agrisoli TaxID=2607653 RepID=A0A5B2VLZ1_9BACT|nr:GNAT family N-acetyltransferase [Chitinophaga agrisoli]KAA2239297.1 GNAT family N-acetyltransferase [Chitinophaga agrisoli]
MATYFPVLKNATAAQLEQAAAFNHQELFTRNAMAQGGLVKTSAGLTCTYGGPDKEAMVGFPVLEAAGAGGQLDAMMDWYRQYPPNGIGCWSLHPPQPADLGIRLLARGFKRGWRPCWMGLDLQKIQTAHPVPAGLELHADNTTGIDLTPNLPYAGEDGAISPALLQQQPEIAQRFIATLNGQVVGHSCVFLTTGPYGAAGIYNVGVVPHAREKGIGKAVVIAACQYAKEQGYHYAVLNATGRRMYNQVGFSWIGDGYTWWLHGDLFRKHPPKAQQIALAEAIGRGIIPANGSFETQDLHTILANGMTLMQLAVQCQQPAAAAWLVERGVGYSALDAWDLGWKDKAAALLATHPEQANQQYGDWQATLLHLAAERNDLALAKLALAAHPDLTITDKRYNGTPLGWAQHLQRNEIIQLIMAEQ